MKVAYNGVFYYENKTWEPWYAWRPVRLVDGSWRWREKILRQHTHIDCQSPAYKAQPVIAGCIPVED